MRYNLVSSQYVSKKKFLFPRHRKESEWTARQSLEKFGLPNSVQFDQKDFTKWSPDNQLQFAIAICSMLLFLLCHTSGTQSKKMKLITGKVKFRMFCLRHCELLAVTSLTSSFGKLLSQNFLHLFHSSLITLDLDPFHQFSGHSLIKKHTLEFWFNNLEKLLHYWVETKSDYFLYFLSLGQDLLQPLHSFARERSRWLWFCYVAQLSQGRPTSSTTTRSTRPSSSSRQLKNLAKFGWLCPKDCNNRNQNNNV